jgi:hypothetical protein
LIPHALFAGRYCADINAALITQSELRIFRPMQWDELHLPDEVAFSVTPEIANLYSSLKVLRTEVRFPTRWRIRNSRRGAREINSAAEQWQPSSICVSWSTRLPAS